MNNSQRNRLSQCLSELSGQLYLDHPHLLGALTTTVEDCGCRLGPVDLGTDDSSSRVVSVFGLRTIHARIAIEWVTTDCGNLEANFTLFS